MSEYNICLDEMDPILNADYIIKNKRKIKKQLIAERQSIQNDLEIRIAVLGGSTTRTIVEMLDLFLLSAGIKPAFWESEYNRYYEDAVFTNEDLEEFNPELIYICTSVRNIMNWPCVSDTYEDVNIKIRREVNRYKDIWESLYAKYNCIIIQNNFDLPQYRLFGNMDAYDYRGRINYVSNLNAAFNEYAATHNYLRLCDINYISATIGLETWIDSSAWYMYKYACGIKSIPYLSYNVANIIKSIYGKSKKVLVCDLDNTLWGGIIGEDGVDNIDIGQENSTAELFAEVQQYLKDKRSRGIVLAVASKNDDCVAREGFERPDSVLSTDDFAVFCANWDNKDVSIRNIAKELNLGLDSMVFIDDNPAERQLVRQSLKGLVAVPEMDNPVQYINILEKKGYFESISISEEDISRNKMYKENVNRKSLELKSTSYKDYLNSLEMIAEIADFKSIYLARITQLINKSNQFNLTTKRYSQAEIEQIYENKSDYVTLYGRLQDRFGDNGVVSVVIGQIDGEILHIKLWLMSCRVLKRHMEYAMMDRLEEICIERGIKTIIGYYYPTKKNGMVSDFYRIQGFELDSTDSDGNTQWHLNLTGSNRTKRQDVIEVVREIKEI